MLRMTGVWVMERVNLLLLAAYHAYFKLPASDIAELLKALPI